MALTRETIWEAADALNAEGVKPTLSAVRGRLKSGSYTTIQEAMTEWKARRQQTTTMPHDPPPPELAERATNLTSEIWTLARRAADAALAGERQQLESERAELRNQLAEAVGLADTLTEDSERMKVELTELRQVRDQAERTAQDIAELKRKSGDEIHRTQERANRKDTEAIEARKSERAALDRAARAEGQVEALTKQLADLTAALKPRTARD